MSLHVLGQGRNVWIQTKPVTRKEL